MLDILAGNIGTWISEDDVWKKFRFESHLGILVKMPVIHPRTGQTGAYSLIAFVTECSLGDVGISLGRLDKNDKGIGDLHYVPVLNPGPIVPAAVEHIQLDPLNVTANFDSDLAARMRYLTFPNADSSTLYIGRLALPNIRKLNEYRIVKITTLASKGLILKRLAIYAVTTPINKPANAAPARADDIPHPR